METFDGNIQVNRYDAEGLRHEMEENGSLVKFIFNPDREAVVEESSSGLTRYIRSSELIVRNTDAARTYYHYVSDEMGSTTHIVDEDGIVLNHYDYDAWGNLTAQEEAVPNRFKFTGQQLDPVTQQYYLRARFYNPVIARFTQEDTYRGDGLNLYAYCHNNPVFYTDPSGNTCPENGKDPLQRVPDPSPNQQQSTALVPYDPHFASEQKLIQGDIYQDAKGRWHDKNTGRFVSTPTSRLNQPKKPNGNASNSSSQFKGKLGEEYVSQVTGLKKNTTIFFVDDRQRIPDFISPKKIIEVKNTNTQSLTQQIKDDIKLASTTGKTFELWTRSNTHLSKPLLDEINAGHIIHKPDLFK